MDLKYQRFAAPELLHPKARQRFRDLADRLNRGYANLETKTCFLLFETYRTPQRQQFLIETSKNTKAGAFASPHQFGLAADFVPFDVEANAWSWDLSHDWDFLDRCAAECKLVRPIAWDRAHIEHPKWDIIRQELKFL